MDSEVEDILKEWGFPHLIELFKGAEIDKEAFQLLDEATLQRLLKPGQFLKFCKVFRANIDSLRDEPPFNKKPRKDSGESHISIESTQVVTVTPSNARGETSSPIIVEWSDSTDNNSIVHGSLMPISIAAGVESLTPLANELKTILSKTLPGRIVLARANDINEADRNTLSEALVLHFMLVNRDSEIKTEQFVQLSEAIPTIFLGEDSTTYYTPYKKIKDEVFHAKGKLLNYYYAWRAKGIEAGIIRRKLRTLGPLSDLCVSCSDEENLSLFFLKSNVSPYQEILSHWKATFANRIQSLSNPDLYVEKYYQLYPALRQPWGYTLLLSDFARLFENNSVTLTSRWKEFATKLCGMFRLKKVLDSAVVDYLESTIKENGDGCQEILSYYSLIFPAQVVVKGHKPHHWQANRAEMQESFFHHVKSEFDRDNFIRRRKAKLTKFPKPVPFQPMCIIEGPTLLTIEKSYALVAGELYQLSNPLEALDVTFKSVHALDLHYSVESKVMWRFLQQVVYGINTSKDESLPCFPALLKLYGKA